MTLELKIHLLVFTMDDIKNVGRLVAIGMPGELVTRPASVVSVLVNGTDSSGKSGLLDCLNNEIFPNVLSISGYQQGNAPFNANDGISPLYGEFTAVSYLESSFNRNAPNPEDRNTGYRLVQNRFPEEIENLGVYILVKSPHLPRKAKESVDSWLSSPNESDRRIARFMDRIRVSDLETTGLQDVFASYNGFQKGSEWPRLISIGMRDDILNSPSMNKIIAILQNTPHARSVDYLGSHVHALRSKPA
ncbi:MAG: hypothetical protein AAF569_05415 [Pseudomonadota bacterium]